MRHKESTDMGLALLIPCDPEITDVMPSLFQFLPHCVMFCPVPPSVIAISFLLGLHASRGITHEFAPDRCSLYFLCAAHLRFYIPFFGFIEQWAWECPG